MSDEAIKRRVADAKKAAKKKCRGMKYRITNSDNEVFCFIAERAGLYEQKIRVVVDEITDDDKQLILRTRILPNQTKAIWCRPYKSRDFIILEFDHQNLPID